MSTNTVETTGGAMTATEFRDQLFAKAADDDEFRARLLADPRALLSEDYGIVLPENLKLHVHEEDATTAHLVLPRSKKLTEEELASAAGADGPYY